MMRAFLYVLLCVLLCLSGAVAAQQETDPEASVANNDEPSGSAEQAVQSKPPEDSGEEEDTSDEDFTPSEEISEDYPVPLPSDI